MDRTKTLFTRKLKGEPVGEDAFGRPVVEGDILVFSTNYSQSADLRLIKIVETVEDTGRWAKPGAVKLKIRRVSREWAGGRGWNMQDTVSYITKLDNTFLLEDPPQFVLDLFEEADNE
jgi:hypothetical protein